MCKEHHTETTCCCCSHNHSHHNGHHHSSLSEWLPMAISACLLAVGLLYNPFKQAEWLLFVLAYVPIALPIFKQAFALLRHGELFNEFTLMIMATLGAFAIGEYPEAVAVLLFYAAGEYFQERAVGRARNDIRALVRLRPERTNVIDAAGKATEVATETVPVNTIIEVKTGGRVPLDGVLLTAVANFDTAALTGEPLPRTLHQGNEVSAGMIATDSLVRIRTTRPYSESALQRILHLVEEAAQRKSPAETFIRRFARIYTPVVTGLFALMALLGPIFTSYSWSECFYRALVFLVISCPCALVVSIPLSYFRGIGVASRKGILFKGGNYLDAITRIGTVVFDKTGTLTCGRFGVTAINTTADTDSDTLLQTIAAVERNSSHPLAQALVAEAQKQTHDQLATATHIKEHAGLGMEAIVNGKTVLVGNAELLSRHGIPLPEMANKPTGATQVFCAIAGRAAGVISLSDQLKADATTAIQQLRNLGVTHIGMLSGDCQSNVDQVAHALGIDQSHGNLLPADKVHALQRIKEQRAPQGVAFVGDGINDAPVLALSDVAIAMGQGGADAAVETADVVIQSDNPSHVADAIRIGRLTRRIVCLNITLAIGVKLAVLLAGAAGYASLWAAVLADTGVALLCIANTYFIQLRNK